MDFKPVAAMYWFGHRVITTSVTAFLKCLSPIRSGSFIIDLATLGHYARWGPWMLPSGREEMLWLNCHLRHCYCTPRMILHVMVNDIAERCCIIFACNIAYNIGRVTVYFGPSRTVSYDAWYHISCMILHIPPIILYCTNARYDIICSYQIWIIPTICFVVICIFFGSYHFNNLHFL